MNDIPSHNILEKIKKNKIVPQSYFRTQWKNYLFWIIWSAIMFFGAISFSFVLLNLMDFRFEFLHYLGIGKYMRLLVDTAPYLWGILSAIAFGAGYVAMRKTRVGYRYHVLFITSVIVLIISMLGVVLHFSHINDRLGVHVPHGPLSSDIAFPAQNRWVRPHDGMLGGKVIEFFDDSIILTDLRDRQWTVVYDDETQFGVRGRIDAGSFVEVIGEKITEDTFHADLVRPLPKHLEDMRDRGDNRMSPRNKRIEDVRIAP